MVPCESASKEVPFECSLCRILSTDSKVWISYKTKQYHASLLLACEQQTHFRSPLLSLPPSIFRRERSDDRKCVCGSQASLLLRRFVFRMAEASAKREWLVMNRKGPWEGYRLRAHRKRDVWVRGMYHAKVLLKRFHFNGHVTGFHP